MASKRPTLEEMCERADPATTVEHFVVCPVCGQIFDCRNADQIHYHSASDNHPPLIGRVN